MTTLPKLNTERRDSEETQMPSADKQPIQQQTADDRDGIVDG
jgi:hypothetical protein